TEHADRVAQETRAEFDAVQRVMEASSRHDMQRQVEVLDAQARRIDLLERRAGELGQALRRVELAPSRIESQPRGIGDGPSAPASPGAQAGSPRRPSAAASRTRAPEGSGASASTPDSASSTTAAGTGPTPPAMLGTSRAPQPLAPAAAAPPRASQ